MGMLAGVEVRVPFLDHRLVEMCAGMPGERRKRLFGDKHLLREAARGLVPDGVRTRAKFGFNGHFPPITQLLASAGKATTASELVTERAVQDKAYFDPRQVRRLQEAGNYHALDAVLVIHMLDQLFISSFDPARFGGAPIAAPEVTVDASWMPVETVLLLARKGPCATDKPWLRTDVTHFGVLESALSLPGRPLERPLLALQRNDGRRTLLPVPAELDATLVVELLRRADGTKTYAELWTSLGVSLETGLAIGGFLSDEGVLEHGPKGLPS